MSAPRCLCGCGELASYNPRRAAYNKYVNDRHRDKYKDQCRSLARAKELDAIPAPLCACGCGERCVRPTNRLAGYPKYLNATHRNRAEDRRKRAQQSAKVRRCACGCGQPVFFQRRYVDATHRQKVNYKRLHTERVQGDLTSAQIEAIITHHQQVLRYERNKQA